MQIISDAYYNLGILPVFFSIQIPFSRLLHTMEGCMVFKNARIIKYIVFTSDA